MRTADFNARCLRFDCERIRTSDSTEIGDPHRPSSPHAQFAIAPGTNAARIGFSCTSQGTAGPLVAS